MLRGLPFAVANRSGKIRFVRDDLTLPGGCAGAITARRPLQFRDRVRYRAGRRAVGRKPPFSRVAAARAFSGGHRALDGAGAGQFRMRGAKLGAPPSLCRRGDPIMLAASPGARGDKTRQARAAREIVAARSGNPAAGPRNLFRGPASVQSDGDKQPPRGLAIGMPFAGGPASQNVKRRPAIGSTELRKR